MSVVEHDALGSVYLSRAIMPPAERCLHGAICFVLNRVSKGCYFFLLRKRGGGLIDGHFSTVPPFIVCNRRPISLHPPLKTKFLLPHLRR